MLKKLLFVLALLPSFVFAQTNLSQGGTGWTSSAVGQLLVGTSSTLRYSRLDVGSAGTVLQASSTSPFRMAWVTLSSIFDSLLSSNNTWTGTNNFTATTTLDKVVAGTSAGLQFFSNGLTQVADFGAGGGSNASFLGGVNITGNLAVDTNTLYVDTTNNRVGIGTTTPQAPLEVYSPSGNVGNMARFSSGYSSGGFVSLFDVANNTTRGYFGYGPTLFTIAGIGDAGFRSQGGLAIGTNGGTVRQYINSSGAFGLGGSITNVSTFAGASLVGNSSGNIGIGTTSPQKKLHVYGDNGTDFLFQVESPNRDANFLLLAASSTAQPASFSFRQGTAGGDGWNIAKNTGNSLVFTSRVSGVNTDRVTVLNSGEVGIGTTTPSARLAIQGTSGSTTPLFSIASSSGTINPILQVIPVATYGGFVGINAPTPTYQLEISSDANSTGRGLLIGQHSADVGAAVITAQKSRGTRSSPTTVVSGDYTFAFAGQSYDGSAYRNTANFGYRTSGTIASNSIPGQWFFAATSSNDTNPYTNGTVRMVIGSDGNVGIGTTTPNSVLTIASSTTSTSTSILNIFNSLSTPIMRILGSGAVLFGTITTANCGNAPCGLTVATTTQFTAGTVARVVGYSSAASTTINLDTTDAATTTINQPTTFVNPTGTAYDGSMFEIRAKATTTQTIYWGTSFASSTDLTNVSSIASGTTRFLFEYRQDVQKWELVGKLGGYIN